MGADAKGAVHRQECRKAQHSLSPCQVRTRAVRAALAWEAERWNCALEAPAGREPQGKGPQRAPTSSTTTG